MKHCPKCRTPYAPTVSFCPKDGTPLEEKVPTGFDTQPDTLILGGNTYTTQAIAATENKFVCPDTWLHNIAESEKNNLRGAVLVTDCEINYRLSNQVKTIEFTFYIFNGSVYTITIDSLIEGEVGFRKEPLSGSAKMVGAPPRNIPQKSIEKFTICQWVNPEEAASIINADSPNADYFYFNNLKIGIRGGGDFPDVTQVRLKLPHSISSHNEKGSMESLTRQSIEKLAALKSERDSLKAQLDTLSATKPNLVYLFSQISVVHIDDNGVIQEGGVGEGSITAIVAKFENKADPPRNVSTAKSVIAHISYYEVNGEPYQYSIDKGAWITEEYNHIDLDVGDTARLVIATQMEMGGILNYQNNNDSPGRRSKPSAIPLRREQFVVHVELIPREQSGAKRDFKFKLTLKPVFSLELIEP